MEDPGTEDSIRDMTSILFLKPEQRMSAYEQFLQKKTQLSGMFGFEPVFMPDFLFDFQAALVEWALRKGRAAIFADCGLGKTIMELVWAENIIRKTNKKVLLLTPLAVGKQTVKEGEKFGIACKQSRDGVVTSSLTVTNYEKLHLFNPADFVGVVCDESSCLKHFSGAMQKAVTRFLLKIPYRLLATATAAPNDYAELGTSSEALGYYFHTDMLEKFFIQRDKQTMSTKKERLAEFGNEGNYYQKLSYRVSQQISGWRLKGQAELPFWQWVCSWARACRTPSDLGYSDERFILPPLQEQTHIIIPDTPPEGMLFALPAIGLQGEREERRRTLQTRSDYIANLVNHKKQSVIWCHLNDEGDALEKTIPDAQQVSGSMRDEEKEEQYDDFTNGRLRVLITKPKIGAWGLNWQHCNHTVTMASHSYEQFYQAIRRFWRFGQLSPVTVDIIATVGEKQVIENMKRKEHAMTLMFARMVEHMQHAALTVRSSDTQKVEVPQWL